VRLLEPPIKWTVVAVFSKTGFEKLLYHEIFNLRKVTHDIVDERAEDSYNSTALLFFSFEMANNLLYLGNNSCYVEHDKQVVIEEFQTIVKVEKKKRTGR
jgi:hypothetical protein